MNLNIYQFPADFYTAAGCGKLNIIAELDMTGSYVPLVYAFVISFLLAAFILGLWIWWRSPKKIQKLLRLKGLGLPELRDYFHLRKRDWLLSFLVALVFSLILTAVFYSLLGNEAYEGLPWWVMLSTSLMSSQTVFGVYHPMPYGVLGTVFLGIMLGRLCGLAIGKKYGAERVLISSRLRKPLKL